MSVKESWGDAQWKNEVALLYEGLNLIPTRLHRKPRMALCALNSCPVEVRGKWIFSGPPDELKRLPIH